MAKVQKKKIFYNFLFHIYFFLHKNMKSEFQTRYKTATKILERNKTSLLTVNLLKCRCLFSLFLFLHNVTISNLTSIFQPISSIQQRTINSTSFFASILPLVSCNVSLPPKKKKRLFPYIYSS